MERKEKRKAQNKKEARLNYKLFERSEDELNKYSEYKHLMNLSKELHVRV